MAKVSSRIPTLRPKSKPIQVTSKDIGKKVCAVDKEGTLRYFGEVHFSKGLWCGIELKNDGGKHDGLVDGIRYFACPPKCGFMVPTSKVTLIDDNYETDDGISGPYSMLFFEKSTTKTKLLNSEHSEKILPRRFTTNVFVAATINETKNSHNTTKFTITSNENELENGVSRENLIKEEFVSVKRRCTVPIKKSQIPSNSSPKSKSFEGPEKPTSLPQLRSHYLNQTYDLNEATVTKTRGEFDEALIRKLQLTCNSNLEEKEEEESKRCSLELDESLGILTPEQMVDGMSLVSVINSPTSECNVILNHIIEDHLEEDCEKLEPKTELPSPNHVDQSITEYSFGIIDEQLLSNLKTDNSMSHNKYNHFWNIDLKDQSPKDYARLEQTPSPEDLPLDPTPIISDPKIDSSSSSSTKSKATTSSFITSITSITSLDTGYQGDGEMSRPASRGADNSPLTRRPLPRPQTRRPDPMTDSDFYTESDADNHEENHLRGDRRAQVIDGTLYGVDPQAAADIYVNNRENMDSSGIFTDIESNPRTEDSHPNTVDVSPSDTSTKTISGNSQTNLQEILEKTLNEREELKQNNNNNNHKTNNNNNNNNIINKESVNVQKDIPNSKKRVAPSPVNSSPSSVRSPRHNSKEEIKKFKTPKREVTSKVKEMLQVTNTNFNEAKSVKKPVGRWDAVMSKISKCEQNKTNLKDVKSKLFSGSGLTTSNLRSERKATNRLNLNQKNINIKQRRTRVRTSGSINSSISDISATGSTTKSSPGSAKKRDVVQVTQVLTTSKLQPRPQSQPNLSEVKKSASLRETKPKRQLLTHLDKKPNVKECGRATVKGGRTSPVVRPPILQRAPAKPTPKIAEALAVLVQHLVFNVEAYKVPVLKKEIQKIKTETEEFKIACQKLEELLATERVNYERILEEERRKFADEIGEIENRHQTQLLQLNNEQTELKIRLTEENEATKNFISQANEEKLMKLKIEFQKLQKAHEEALDILREENDAIREQIDEKDELLQQVKHESVKLREDYEAKEMKLKQQMNNIYRENQKLVEQIHCMEDKIKDRMRNIHEDNAKLKEENNRLLSYSDSSDEISVQEVQSLRAVLELKQTEISDLRRALAEATQKNDILTGAEEKASALNARCEDLQLQLQRKTEYEQYLLSENKRLQDNFKEETNQKKRLTQFNEELQWKLEQNKEVVNKVLEEAEKTVLSRSLFSASFREKASSTRQNLERTLSFREKSTNLDYSTKKQRSDNNSDDLSPPSSPKVKGVIEKSDWVSYVLDLDESPDIVASRIVRRSFRNSTLNKSTTPTKSPSNKRPRMKNPLSLSSSASSILTTSNNPDYSRSRSLTNGSSCHDDKKNDLRLWVTSSPKHFDGNSNDRDHAENEFDFEEDDHDVDLELPALPSEIGRRNGDMQALPSPKHLATEVMISESNSDDESTSSSSVQL